MKVEVRRDGTRSRVVTHREVERAAEACLRASGRPRAELSVLLCGDRQIHRLNRVYRHKNRPTDVLAFALAEGPSPELSGEHLGDVVLSLETATRQAREHGVRARDEVLHLLAHGVLHLLGWDHRTDAEDRRMRAETERLLGRVRRALGEPTAPPRRGARGAPRRGPGARRP
ncbi:MAG: rRNA maturation RNase YbeY [Deltaproteobacteria bacterium]|nr:rRNA maturation RNase YbeY [Deltaproteobacteria bacterium]